MQIKGFVKKEMSSYLPTHWEFFVWREAHAILSAMWCFFLGARSVRSFLGHQLSHLTWYPKATLSFSNGMFGEIPNRLVDE